MKKIFNTKRIVNPILKIFIFENYISNSQVMSYYSRL